NDNIVAYWVPKQPMAAGDARVYRYRLSTTDRGPSEHVLAQVVRTRNGWGAVPGTANPPPHSKRQFIVDFQGGELTSLSAALPLQVDLTLSAGKVSDVIAQRLPGGGWRAAFKLQPEA